MPDRIQSVELGAGYKVAAKIINTLLGVKDRFSPTKHEWRNGHYVKVPNPTVEAYAVQMAKHIAKRTLDVAPVVAMAYPNPATIGLALASGIKNAVDVAKEGGKLDCLNAGAALLAMTSRLGALATSAVYPDAATNGCPANTEIYRYYYAPPSGGTPYLIYDCKTATTTLTCSGFAVPQLTNNVINENAACTNLSQSVCNQMTRFKGLPYRLPTGLSQVEPSCQNNGYYLTLSAGNRWTPDYRYPINYNPIGDFAGDCTRVNQGCSAIANLQYLPLYDAANCPQGFLPYTYSYSSDGRNILQANDCIATPAAALNCTTYNAPRPNGVRAGSVVCNDIITDNNCIHRQYLFQSDWRPLGNGQFENNLCRNNAPPGYQLAPLISTDRNAPLVITPPVGEITPSINYNHPSGLLRDCERIAAYCDNLIATAPPGVYRDVPRYVPPPTAAPPATTQASTVVTAPGTETPFTTPPIVPITQPAPGDVPPFVEVDPSDNQDTATGLGLGFGLSAAGLVVGGVVVGTLGVIRHVKRQREIRPMIPDMEFHREGDEVTVQIVEKPPALPPNTKEKTQFETPNEPIYDEVSAAPPVDHLYDVVKGPVYAELSQPLSEDEIIESIMEASLPKSS